MKNLDWSLLQSFVTVCEHGSFSAAARETGSSQASLSRHISLLEQQLDTRLFERTVNGVELTKPGLSVYKYANDMANSVGHLSMAVDGTNQTISGTVRVTAATMMATYILPNIISSLRLEEPLIDIELVASNKTENLVRREADIAVRLVTPTQSNLYAKKLGDMEFSLYASNTYLDRHGPPETANDLWEHDVIGFDTSDLIITGMHRYGIEVDRDFFAFRSDDHIVCWQMVQAGMGIGIVQKEIGDSTPNVTRIDLPNTLSTYPIWLIAHSELKSNLRVRRVFDYLADGIIRQIK
ncbi:LysR family transcriptional regulator [Hirschia maritima]|uniref:LysR family transcriptional regulator n=1 Tax=Hirschia maritima TaxID=1121961 RepID=UPI00036A5941|nr:LysR family transcriptional regulator [Hirschia maritima]